MPADAAVCIVDGVIPADHCAWTAEDVSVGAEGLERWGTSAVSGLATLADSSDQGTDFSTSRDALAEEMLRMARIAIFGIAAMMSSRMRRCFAGYR